MAKIGSIEIFFQPSKRITHWRGNYQLLHPGRPFQRQSPAKNQQHPLRDGCFDEIWCWEGLSGWAGCCCVSCLQRCPGAGGCGRLLDSVNFQGSLSLNHWLSGAKTSQASDLGKKEVEHEIHEGFTKGCVQGGRFALSSHSPPSFVVPVPLPVFLRQWFDSQVVLVSTFCGVCTGYKKSGFLQLPPVTGTKLDQARRT